MTYEYEVITTGAIVEVQQRMSDPAHTVLEIDGELRCVRRLISGAPAVQFISGPSGGWSSAGYALTPAQRKAEAKLGRRVIKRA